MSDMSEKVTGPHRGQPVLVAGEQIEQARAAMIMVHGRGASAEDILGVADSVRQTGFVYLAPQAAGYSWYVGAAAGNLALYYYSDDLGTWHIVVLNSECAAVGGCDENSQQGKWLQQDLRKHKAACTLAYFS